MTELSNSSKSLAIIGASAVTALVIIGVFTALLVGRDVADTMPVVLAVAIPTITSLFTIAGVRADLEKVRAGVNGNLDRVVAERDRLARYADDLLCELDQVRASSPDAQTPIGRHRPPNEGTHS